MRRGFRRLASAVAEPQVLDTYDVAFLAGGTQRVADCAVIALAERGLLKLSGPRVRAVGEALPQHPWSER
ncbi:TIGR04222 domain-containing membrane protein [Streptomyces sp. NPDC006458]|uniref:TIGR04222 domain-containing membrane protein n=1 Tax=Streptomyces sp. NPDC006458 TaxID=3154302 RepID=UPI0033A38F89